MPISKASSNAVAPGAKGDLVVGTTTNDSGILGVGSNGETLVADSSASTGLRWQSNFAAGKNKVINGDFGIWQRGTSVNLSAGTNTFLADRFFAYMDSNAGTFNYSQQTFTPGTAPVAGYEGQYFARLTTGGNVNMAFTTKIEDVRTLSGQTVTVSFWAKSSTAKTFGLLVRQDFGTGGSAAVDNFTSYTTSTSWQRFTYTFSLPSVSGKTIGSNSNISVQIVQYGSQTGNFTVDFWGVQLEAGNTATAFQTATGTLAGELAACQRYYQRFTSDNVSLLGFVIAQTAANAYGIINLKTTMRATPTTLDISGLGITDTNTRFVPTTAFAIYANGSNKDFVALSSLSFTGLTTNRPYMFELGSSAGFVGFGAEL